jgi:predicted DNA binding CopG/RHH family protein
MKYLDKEEKELIESIEKGEWKTINKKEHAKYISAADESLKKSKRINIRLSSKDLHDVQLKAIEEGLPYQTLITSLIHKYVSGKLKPVK